MILVRRCKEEEMRFRYSITRLALSLIVVFSVCLGAYAQVTVTTHRNDNSRTGQNLEETALNTSNVNSASFGKLFTRSVDGEIYAQPLYVSNLKVKNKTRNVVYVATEGNNVYAFDADDPTAAAPLWQVNLGTPVPDTDVASYCIDIQPQVGVTGTPVIDTGSDTIYVVAKSRNTADNTYKFQIHALDLVTGAEKFGGPTDVFGRVPGTGDGSHDGYLYFYPLHHNNRPGLLLLNGTVYVGFGATCDVRPWHGWIFGFDASTLKQNTIYSTTPNGYSAGIWGGGEGLLADSSNIYVMTGNGSFDVNHANGTDYGDSVVKLSTTGGLQAVDYFTPFDQAFYNDIDLDLGSGGPVALPGTSLIVAMGKDAHLRLIDSNDMGQYHDGYNADLQEFLATTSPQFAPFMGAPIYWNSPGWGPVLYMWGSGDYVKAYQFTNGRFNEFPVSQSTTAGIIGYSNAVPLSLSANGNQAGTGIVWSSGPYSGDANQKIVHGIVRAFDATNLANELWNSRQNATRDDVGTYAKFCPPTIANGKVYVATFSNRLVVYGLLP
jgi:hypothetical protein